MDSADLPDRSGERQAGSTTSTARTPPEPADGGLTLTVLGCAGTYAGPGGACSGYLIRTAGTTLLVDLGAGSLANLQRHVGIGDVDAVVLSHEHPDHWLDLPLMRNALRYVLGLGDVPVYGTSGTRRHAGQIIGDLEPTLCWEDIDAAADVEVGDLRMRFSRTDHPVETLAVRIDGAGRSLLYTADTGPAWDPTAIGDGVDLLVSEASFAVEDEGTFQHLSGRQAGALAATTGAGRLLVTHVAPGVDPEQQGMDAAGEFAGPIDVAVEGRTIVV